LTRQSGIVRFFSLLGLVAACGSACGGASNSVSTNQSQQKSGVARGGQIVASLRTDPRSFNRLIDNDVSSDLVAELTQARLVRINKITWEAEPWLAERWTLSDDKLRYTITLRDNVVWSDGQPFTADDVVFTFAALYEGKSPLGDSVQVGGKNLVARATDPHTVVVTFPSLFAPGLRLLDNFPVLPKHMLEPSLKKGEFAKAWGLSTAPSQLVGLGPFVLKEYASGQRMIFERNPHYWRKSANGDALPYLDRIIVEVIPDQNAELLRLENGQLDMTSSEVSPEAYATIRRAADAGRINLADIGVARQADSFWINLKPGAIKDGRAGWLQRDEFRRAISMAVDRKAFADTVFFGAADPVYGPVTPAVKKWYWTGTPQTPYDPEGARKLLASIGVPLKTPTARFQLIVQKNRPRMERAASALAEQLQKIGLIVDVVTYEGLTVVQRWQSAAYEALYFAPGQSDDDPAINPDFWFSSGANHFWNPSQPKPAKDWEKQIDALMTRQSATFDDGERKRLFDEAQKIFAEHLPVLYFAAPRIYIATSKRVTHATPELHWIPILWAADEVAVSK